MKLASALAASVLAASVLAAGCDEPSDDPPAPVGKLPTITFAADAPTVGSGLVVTRVDASDAEGLAEVRLYLDDRWVARSTEAPYDLIWSVSEAAEGFYDLRAVAIDRDGNEAAATAVFVVDHTGPEIDGHSIRLVDLQTFEVDWSSIDVSATSFVHLYLNQGSVNAQRWRCTAEPRSVVVIGCSNGHLGLQGEDVVGNLGPVHNVVLGDDGDCNGLSLRALPEEGRCVLE